MSDFQTTVRLDAAIKASVDKLKSVQKCTLNRLINDALAVHIETLLAEKSEAIESAQRALQAYRAADPDFEAAIADVVASETAGYVDPVEGQIVTRPVATKGESKNDKPSAIRSILDE